jgi:hypothetical protein
MPGKAFYIVFLAQVLLAKPRRRVSRRGLVSLHFEFASDIQISHQKESQQFLSFTVVFLRTTPNFPHNCRRVDW